MCSGVTVRALEIVSVVFRVPLLRLRIMGVHIGKYDSRGSLTVQDVGLGPTMMNVMMVPAKAFPPTALHGGRRTIRDPLAPSRSTWRLHM